MSNICLGNLLTSSVLAYDNIDLIPNGFIPQNGTTARPSTRTQGGVRITSREEIKLLPADRIYAEFWYGVQSRITGTNLGDAGSGVFDILGFLGGGAGAVIGGALACELTGDSEKVSSRWVFHVCDAETRINREHILTEQDVQTKTITLPDYVIGVLGVTRTPIVFVTPTTPLTAAQIAEAQAMPADQVEAILGHRVAPDQLTDSDIRLLLGIPDLNELENLGNTNRGILGWPQSSNGQIQGVFKNYDYSSSKNLFITIVRDDRKNHYRADNEYDRNQGHCFWNGSTDDLTDKVINFNLQEQSQNGEPPDTSNVKLKTGDKVYISYVAAITPIFRHAIENITNFFLFPDQTAYQLPPLDLIKGWNFKKFKFKVRKNETERASLTDILNDEKIQQQINNIQNDNSIIESEKESQIQRLQSKLVLNDMECQRLIESKLEKAFRNPIIKGCYFADSRGILMFNFKDTLPPQLIVPKEAIRDQQWFEDFLKEIQNDSIAFDENGELLLSDANDTFFDDFLFDVSDHVNTTIYDNDKYGYERRLALAISKCSIFNQNDPATGVGFPNLDLIKNKSENRSSYDLTSAKFESIPMQGTAHLFSCNVTFTYDFGFCTKGTISADMLLRTPTFLESLTKKSRIYVEKFSAQFPLRKDGSIWVGTKPAFEENYSVTTDPKRDFGYVVYPDSTNGTTSYRVFEDGVLQKDYKDLKYSDAQNGHSLPPIDDSLTESNIEFGGYDMIIGDQPGYFNGKEITLENALIAVNKESSSVIKTTKPSFTRSDTGRINVSGESNNRIRKIIINYKPSSFEFLNIKDRLLAVVFPSSKNVIDNIGVPYQGKFATYERKICIEAKYIPSNGWFIDGEVLKFMDIISIETEIVSEDNYQKYKISSPSVSTCFDSSGNWYVVYEDEKGGEGETAADGRNADGSHLIGPFNENSFPGLQENTSTEISCLVSSDYGYTWFCYKAIVRTVAGDEVHSPYCISDYQNNKIHLFYILNDNLMHKIIDTSFFNYEDAFLGYKRPNSLNEETIKSYGLFHFTSGGIKLREESSSVVIGNISGDYLKSQLSITQKLKDIQRNDYRIFSAGDEKEYTDGFANVDFLAYKDAAGELKVMFIYNGKFYCRESPNGGIAWYDIIKDGMLIHKNSNLQELKSVNSLGFAIDIKKNFSYLTYQVDGMLFLRRFESGASLNSNFDVANVLNADSSNKPIFVIGSLASDVKNALKNKDTPIVFPYKDIDVFGESFSISDSPSLGYMTASGILRFFYKDSAGNFRAFSYSDTPYLDINYSKGN